MSRRPSGRTLAFAIAGLLGVSALCATYHISFLKDDPVWVSRGEGVGEPRDSEGRAVGPVRVVGSNSAFIEGIDMRPGRLREAPRAAFTLENDSQAGVRVLQVVRSCGCLDAKIPEVLPPGRTEVSIAVQPRRGGTTSQHATLILENEQIIKLEVSVAADALTLFEIGTPVWEADGRTLLIPLTAYGDVGQEPIDVFLHLQAPQWSAGLPCAPLAWKSLTDADGTRVAIHQAIMRFDARGFDDFKEALLVSKGADLTRWIRVPERSMRAVSPPVSSDAAHPRSTVMPEMLAAGLGVSLALSMPLPASTCAAEWSARVRNDPSAPIADVPERTPGSEAAAFRAPQSGIHEVAESAARKIMLAQRPEVFADSLMREARVSDAAKASLAAAYDSAFRTMASERAEFEHAFRSRAAGADRPGNEAIRKQAIAVRNRVLRALWDEFSRILAECDQCPDGVRALNRLRGRIMLAYWTRLTPLTFNTERDPPDLRALAMSLPMINVNAGDMLVLAALQTGDDRTDQVRQFASVLDDFEETIGARCMDLLEAEARAAGCDFPGSTPECASRWRRFRMLRWGLCAEAQRSVERLSSLLQRDFGVSAATEFEARLHEAHWPALFSRTLLVGAPTMEGPPLWSECASDTARTALIANHRKILIAVKACIEDGEFPAPWYGDQIREDPSQFQQRVLELDRAFRERFPSPTKAGGGTPDRP